MASLTVTSNLFSEGSTIPRSAAHGYAGGDNISPDLAWTGVPEGTASLALACHDPDAPTTVGFTHWLLFDLDPEAFLEGGAGAAGKNPPGSVLGFTDWGASEYGGMAPPAGDPAHHYRFTVYALDVAKLDGAGPTTTYALFRFLIRGHVLAEGTLTGLFQA
ncbi:MAG TPA: YbhB/YbcL family Raf kinase inhibitor-like protein [Mycobacteriales bacterium]|nr:YbhB/YbcL family Raf kinase inhibitor-like protein [Mycobacteriales bacterium]